MKKINLEQKIFNIKGKALQVPVLDEKGKFIPSSNNKNRQMRDSTLRDYLLTILSSRFKTINNKENFWTTELGIEIADEKNKILEVSDPQFNFLKRIVEANKMMNITQTPMGVVEKEIEIFYPFELGQLLRIFQQTE